MVPFTRPLALALLAATAAPGAASDPAFRLPPQSTQALVGLAASWDASHVKLQRYERAPGGAWRAVGEPFPGRLGREGLAWGLGLHPGGLPGKSKREGDWRAPAGVFLIGGAYGAFGYESDVARHPSLPYTQVTARDLWIEDAASRDYNTHVRVPPGRDLTRWEEGQRMKTEDPAHKLKLFVAHNSGGGVVPGGGSSIFFHIWRDGGKRPSAGCTTVPEPALRELVRWADPARTPLFVLLPEPEYKSRRDTWGLP